MPQQLGSAPGARTDGVCRARRQQAQARRRRRNLIVAERVLLLPHRVAVQVTQQLVGRQRQARQPLRAGVAIVQAEVARQQRCVRWVCAWRCGAQQGRRGRADGAGSCKQAQQGRQCRPACLSAGLPRRARWRSASFFDQGTAAAAVCAAHSLLPPPSWGPCWAAPPSSCT